jgi:P-type Ca2+ transporter type 2C
MLRDNESKERDGRWTGQDDPTEGVLMVVARRLRPVDEALDARFERIEEFPFSSERKLMTTIHRDESGRNAYLSSLAKRRIALRVG